MTLEELKVIVADLKIKTRALQNASFALNDFITKVDSRINDEFASAISVDDFVALQTPMYLGLLTEVEVAADALGTDQK